MLLASCSPKEDKVAAANPKLTNAVPQGIQFKVGEVWSYKTRPNEEGSKLTICKVEDGELGKIVHVSVKGVQVKSPQSPGGIATEISHIPLSYAAVESSITTLVSENAPVADFEQAIKKWKEVNSGRKPYIFTTSVADTISFLEIVFSQGQAQ